jgi:hypothetical protein
MAEAAEEVIEEEIVEEVIEDEVTPTWPEDWRVQIAGEDEKALKQLGRYQSPADIWTKARALEQRITSGELKDNAPFPEKGSDEEKATWRANNQIPDSADKYEIKHEIGEEEKPVIDAFLQFAHERNIPQKNVGDMVDWFYNKQEGDLEAMAEESKVQAQEAEDNLRAEWGAEYRAYVNHVDNLIELAPAEVKDIFLDAQLADGRTLRNSPEAMKFLLGLALEQNPITTLTPGKGGDTLDSIEDRMEEIRGKMNTPEYQKGPLRKEYNELLTARARYRK